VQLLSVSTSGLIKKQEAKMTSTGNEGQIRLVRISDAYWRVTFDIPPLNIFGPANMARLPRLLGRGRALEVLLGADGINVDLAELYGYVNHSIPDSQFEDFVDTFARRISSFDRQAIAETKRLVDLNSLPSDAEIVPEWDAFIASLERPAAQARLRTLFERGFHEPGDVENRLGYYVGTLGSAVEVSANTV
jgi:enoyl-CoA hydratase/carnithine racemase